MHKQSVDHCRQGLLPEYSAGSCCVCSVLLLGPWMIQQWAVHLCGCVYIYGEEGWVSSHAVCLKCVSSTSYQEQPWKCSCRAVSLSVCHGGSRHAPWPRRPRHLPREMGGDGWMERGRRWGGVKKQKRNKTMWGEEWETDDVKWCSGSAEVIEKETDGERNDNLRKSGCRWC